MRYIGIDPGVSGGIANLLQQEPGLIPLAHAEPSSDVLQENYSALIQAFDDHGSKALIERVAPMPGEGVRSVFTFGRNVGQWEAFLTAMGVPFEYVGPKEWQAEFGLLMKRANGVAVSRTEKKNKHKDAAQKLFPKLKVTHAIADALLIAEYCRRKELGLVKR